MLNKLSTSLGFTRRTKSIAYSKGYWLSDIFGMPGYRPNWIKQSSVTIINHNCDKIWNKLEQKKFRDFFG